MRVGNTVPEVGTVFDWDIDEILERQSVDSGFYNDDWEEMLTQKRMDYHYPDVLESIRRWGFVRPLTAYKNDEADELFFGDGHHRLAAAIQLGMTVVPVEVRPSASMSISEDSGSWVLEDGIEHVKDVRYEEVDIW